MRFYSHFRISEYGTFEFDVKNYALPKGNFLSIYDRIKILFKNGMPQQVSYGHILNQKFGELLVR